MDLNTLSERFCDYSLTVRGLSMTTVISRRTAIRVYSRVSGTSTLEEATEESLRSFFYKGRTELRWSTGTYITYYRTLLAFFRWCLKQHYLAKNPLEAIEIPKHRRNIPSKLSKQQALQLLEIVSNYPYKTNFQRRRNHAIFATFIFAGLRLQELLHLRFSDVDLENLTIFVYQGKGNKDRIVPMSATLAQSLKSYIHERNKLKKTGPQFFSSLHGNLAFTKAGLKNVIKQACRASGFTFSAHKLRHTFATLMLEGGCDIYSISRMMGHADISTTTIYLSATAELLRNQMTKHPLNDIGLPY